MLQLEKYGFSFEPKNYTTFGWTPAEENVIGMRAFEMDMDINLVQLYNVHL